MKKKNGFSLVELLIVIAILGIILAIAIPGFRIYAENARLKTAVRGFQSDIVATKQKAMAESAYYRIVLQIGANGYEIQKGDVVDTVITYAKITDKNFAQEGNISITSSNYGDNEIIFDPRGTTSAGTIQLRNNTSKKTSRISTTVMGKVYVH